MSESLTEAIKNSFSLKKTNPKEASPLVLAYIGDNVYELVNRTISVSAHDIQVNKLHKECSTRAKAETQSKMVSVLEELFTEEEMTIYKRGRNATSYTKAKNASTLDYRRATGLEALIGYLYLDESYERITFLLKTGWDALNLTKES